MCVYISVEKSCRLFMIWASGCKHPAPPDAPPARCLVHPADAAQESLHCFFFTHQAETWTTLHLQRFMKTRLFCCSLYDSLHIQPVLQPFPFPSHENLGVAQEVMCSRFVFSGLFMTDVTGRARNVVVLNVQSVQQLWCCAACRWVTGGSKHMACEGGLQRRSSAPVVDFSHVAEVAEGRSIWFTSCVGSCWLRWSHVDCSVVF